MSPEKRTPVILPQPRTYRRQLEYLYARRSAIDDLIRSLETYSQCAAKPAEEPSRKLA